MPVNIEEMEVDVTPPPVATSPATAPASIDNGTLVRLLLALLAERERIRARLAAD